ncbi:DNA-3-methyladenine glycosylase I [Bosea sp. LC85]|uniref:DNA-3-methyladenine glycosylase I n=1 Tax=Bosea sp. LC85 TaxID=1502851 RepID=UPI0004E42B2A|nr:DNA-3-methyladenine glycosylase I [Bosea sp. LC85]KFC72730.1 DNA-3-methyladenine glycosylase I [Bosea sp. LC85]
MSGTTIPGPDGRLRCRWCAAAPEFLSYHDKEWGFPVSSDNRLFEKLSLEAFQSGLSWRTILAKRENFRRAFHGFDIARVARFDAGDVQRLLADEGIVRHRGKIEAVINNAQRAEEIVREFGSLAAWVWSFDLGQALPGEAQTRSTSPESVVLSKALKKRGWQFVGPTTVYAFMQAMGLVNDHSEDCVIRADVDAARATFRRPGASTTTVEASPTASL